VSLSGGTKAVAELAALARSDDGDEGAELGGLDAIAPHDLVHDRIRQHVIEARLAATRRPGTRTPDR
jgi:phosphoribosylamine-glycine ligase